jgi:hypothetical protein
VTTTQNSFRCSRHAALILAIALWLLSFAVIMFFGRLRFGREMLDEAIRLTLSVGIIALLAFQWILYRKSTSGRHFAFLTAMLVALSLPAVWLAINVVRFYTYNASVEHADSVEASIHWLAIRVQDGLIWVGLMAFVVATVLGVSDAFQTLRQKPMR